MSNIESTVSATALHFKNSPVDFEITVKNVSDKFASFKVNLTAAGADPNLGDSWYSLDPIATVLIPSGDTTNFRVKILQAPILGMDLINIEVKVSSLELPDTNFHNLKLRITSVPKLLPVYLPVDSFAIYPRKILDIPVRVSNPNHYQVDVVLRLTGLNSRWLERGNERRLLIGAGKEGEVTFTCQPPIVKHTPCGHYPFTIKAYVNDEEWGQTTGKIEILAIGTVFFTVTPQVNALPSKPSWLPQFQIKPATYQLQFKNASNVTQERITIALEGKRCDCNVIPSYGRAKPGETVNLQLEASQKRPWWGLKGKYPLKIIPDLSDPRLNSTEPSSQNVELWVHPLLPLWLQLGLGAIATAFIFWLFSLLSIAGHSQRVNSVSFSSNINPILSGSTDGTVRRWEATPDSIFCQWLKQQRFCLRHKNILLNNATIDDSDAVNVVKLRSDNNLSGEFAFFGFDSGKFSKFNISKQEETVIINNRDSNTSDRSTTNRILDITISPDFKTVFLGQGTKLLQWNSLEKKYKNLIDRNISIHVITLTPDNKTIVAGGQYNTVFRIELNDNSKSQELKLHPLLNRDADRITGLKITENNILISTDNRGLIRFWNFNNCNSIKCKLLYSNERELDRGIKAIALAKYAANKYYLVTGDTAGKIKIWSFVPNLKRIDLNLEKTIQYSQQINSIDLIHQKNNSHNRLLILSGDRDSAVRLDIYNILN